MIPRLVSTLLPKVDEKKLILLTGARQVGKTTLVKDLYSTLRYINLDAIENREKLEHVTTNAWVKDVGPAIIDEAQKQPLVFEKIKYNFDEGNLAFSVLLGSSQILLLKKIRESLAGRISIFELYPLMLCELIAKKTVQPPLFAKLLSTKNSINSVLLTEPTILFENETTIKQAEEHLLQVGGMPALLTLPNKESCFAWIKDYEQTYLERDLADLARINDLQPFRLFQKLSALRSAQLINYSELARDAGFSVDTAKRYLEYLKLSYQVILLQPYYKNLTSALVKTPKLYWLDIGILRSLTNFQGEVNGSLFETHVVAEIIKWIKSNRERAEVYFYRTRHGLEIDLIIETSTGIIPIEIKSRTKIDSRDINNLLTIKAHAENWLGGIVIYRGNEILQLAEDIWAIPSWRFFS